MTRRSSQSLTTPSPSQGEGRGGWPTSFGGGGGDDRGHDAERFSSSPPGPKDLGHPITPYPTSPLNERGARRGFSMVEAVFCVVLVGGLVVVSLDTLGASKVAQRSLGDRTRGSLLASALMSEILNQSYQDPNETPMAGLELSENSLLRTTYDDVDDYLNWTASPPQNRDGTTIPGLTGWRESVKIEGVDPANLNSKKVPDSGVKRITVTITHNNVVVATLVGVKTGTPNPLLSF